METTTAQRWLYPLAFATLLSVAAAALVWPGGMSVDSIVQFKQTLEWKFGAGHPVMMGIIWRLTNAVVPGGGGLLLLQMFFYFLGFWLIARHLFTAAAGYGKPLLALGLALWPPSVLLMGVLWKDGLMSAFLVFSLGLILSYWQRPRAPALIGAFAAIFVASSLRINSLPAIVPLVAMLLCPPAYWGARPSGLGIAGRLVAAVVIAVTMFGATSLMTRALGVRDNNAWSFIALYDIVGTAINAGVDVESLGLPMATRPISRDEVSRLYTPRMISPLLLPWCAPTCRPPLFVKSERPEDLAAVKELWWDLVLRHPLAYLKHRAAIFAQVIGATSDPAWAPYFFLIQDNPWGFRFDKPDYFQSFEAGVERLSQTFIFEVWIYLMLLCGALAYSVSAKGRRDTRLVLAGLGLSGILYVVPYFFLAVSVDYRYSHWAVICGSVCAVVLAHSSLAALRQRGDETASRASQASPAAR